MAEKGIVVADASSGESVACRDGYAQDDQSNSRIVQIVDLASRHDDITYANAFRSKDLSTGVAWDGNTSSFPSFDSLNTSVSQSLTVGDGNLLVVGATVEILGTATIADSSRWGIVVIPAILDSGDNIVGMLKPKMLQLIFNGGSSPYSVSSTTYYKNTQDYEGSTFYNVILPRQTWHIDGAAKIKLFIHAKLGTTASNYRMGRIFADIVSGPSDASGFAYEQYTGLRTAGDNSAGGGGE